MKKLILFGDSNTYGYNPVDCSRFDDNTRWSGILKNNLGIEYEIIEEGLCDRVGFSNNPKGFQYCAQRHFPKLLSKLSDIDTIVLALGTNDLQTQYDISFSNLEKGLEKLIQLSKEKSRQTIVISPVILNEKVLEGNFSFQYSEMSIIKSRKIGRIYRQLANIYGCIYTDINKIAKPSDIDGLHYDKIAHKIIADKLIQLIN